MRQLGSKLVLGCTSPASTALLAPLLLCDTGLAGEVGCAWHQDGQVESSVGKGCNQVLQMPKTRICLLRSTKK